MSARLAALALCVLGCNAVFDIGDTSVVETIRDTDGDGILDNLDNCIDVVNPGQEENDGDALGDACDRCPGVLGDSDHDEDLDQRPDACDACPGLDDFDGTDTDADGVGEACDYDSHLTERVAFEPFIAIADNLQGVGTWDVTTDDTFGAPEAVAPDARGLTLAGVTLAANEWSATVGIVSSQHPGPGDRAGIVTVGPTDAVTSCTAECGAVTCSLRLVVDDAVVSTRDFFAEPLLVMRLEVKLVNAGSGVYSFTCETGSSGTLTYSEKAPIAHAWSPGVVAGPTMRVSYLDVVQ